MPGYSRKSGVWKRTTRSALAADGVWWLGEPNGVFAGQLAISTMSCSTAPDAALARSQNVRTGAQPGMSG
ncbi:hypothetical protein BH18ACT12_BH18ACT12_08960 [soil metagenome]